MNELPDIVPQGIHL